MTTTSTSAGDARDTIRMAVREHYAAIVEEGPAASGCCTPAGVPPEEIASQAGLPAEVRTDLALHAACVAGASTVTEAHAMLAQAGFMNTRIPPRREPRAR